MKKFLKENSYEIVRLLLNQIGLSMFGLVMAMATVKTGTAIRVVIGVFCIAFYLWLIYDMMYRNGQKDGIKIESGRMRYFPAKGALIAFFANIPNLILGILMFLGGFMFERTGASSWGQIYQIFGMIGKFFQGMYLGLIAVLFTDAYWTLLLTPLPAIVVCGIGYVLGVKYCDGFFPNKNTKEQSKY